MKYIVQKSETEQEHLHEDGKIQTIKHYDDYVFWNKITPPQTT